MIYLKPLDSPFGRSLIPILSLIQRISSLSQGFFASSEILGCFPIDSLSCLKKSPVGSFKTR